MVALGEKQSVVDAENMNHKVIITHLKSIPPFVGLCNYAAL